MYIRCLKKTILFLILLACTPLYIGANENFDRRGVICFEMGSEVAFFFINGKVIRYSAFHMFDPPVELQKKLYGAYTANGSKLEWRDDSTRVKFTLDINKLALAANNNWSASSNCEENSLAEIKEYFKPILEQNKQKRN